MHLEAVHLPFVVQHMNVATQHSSRKGSYRIQTSPFTHVIRCDRCFIQVRKPRETLWILRLFLSAC